MHDNPWPPAINQTAIVLLLMQPIIASDCQCLASLCLWNAQLRIPQVLNGFEGWEDSRCWPCYSRAPAWPNIWWGGVVSLLPTFQGLSRFSKFTQVFGTLVKGAQVWVFRNVVFQDVDFQNTRLYPSPITALGVKSPHHQFWGSINYDFQTSHPQTPHPWTPDKYRPRGSQAVPRACQCCLFVCNVCLF